MGKHNRIQKTSGVYICSECHRQTRDTGHDEADYGMCRNCCDIASLTNALDDGKITQADYEAGLGPVAKRMLKGD